MIRADRFASSALPHFAGMLVVLTLVAGLSPQPYPTDQTMMERVGQGVIVPGCADLNCFRILVPAILEALPGSSMLRWRGFAVVTNAGAAIATGYLVLALGVSGSAATWAAWLAATSAGAFATVHHPYNADPLVLLLAPIIMTLMVRSRWVLAAALGVVGILAKEFAAAPIYISAASSALARRWRESAWQFGLAIAVTGVWVTLQIALMTLFNYSYNDNPSSQPLSGGYLRLWVTHVTPLSGFAAIFGAFGAAYLLMPFGWRFAPVHLRRLAMGALPAVAALVYVATPERALGNFFFLWLPIAALVLARVPAAAAAAFVAAFAVANMRIGGQMTAVPNSRYALALSIGIAIYAIWETRRQPAPLPS